MVIFPAMSLAVTYKDQPPTMIDDDLQAYGEAQEMREPDAEGEDEEEEAEDSESSSDDDAQEDDENDDFDENAGWSDEEEGEYDIVRKYDLVWCKSWEGEQKAYEGGAYKGSFLNIRGSAEQDQGEEPFRCTADFKWRGFVAQFTCIYRSETQSFTDFKAKTKTLAGGMEDLRGVKVRLWEETLSKEMGELVRGRKEVRDDRDHLFLFMQMYTWKLGIEEVVYFLYGKQVVEDGGQDNTALTEGEKERLGLPQNE